MNKEEKAMLIITLFGLMGLVFFYGHEVGFMNGAKFEKFDREIANNKVQNCNKILAGIKE